MKKEKRKNPYQRLVETGQEFVRKLKHAHSRTMFSIDKKDLNKNYSLYDVYERTQAANQLGYDVVIRADDSGLEIRYKKHIDPPWEFRV